MTKFQVTLRRVVYSVVTVEAESAAEVKRMLQDENSDLDLFHEGQLFGDLITIKSIKKDEVTA